MFDACLDYLGDINVGINANNQKVDMYFKGVFNYKSFTITEYIGCPNPDVITLPADTGIQVIPLVDSRVQEVLEYDFTIHHTARGRFMQRWFSRPGMKTFVALTDGAVVGYVCSLSTLKLCKVAPFYANTPAIARILWISVIGGLDKDSNVQVAAVSEESKRLFLETLHLQLADDNVRMYTKNIEDMNLEVVYSVCSHELTII